MITRFRTTRAVTIRAPQLSTMRTFLNSLWLTLAFGALVAAGYQVSSGQWHATPVLSGSMRPGLQPGDVIVTHRVPISDLQVRDVIVFHPPDEADRLTVHRIVKLERNGGTTSVTTWGDANRVVDPSVSSLRGTTAYRVARVVPLLGYPAMWLQTGNHGMLVIALGVILLITAVGVVLRPDKPTPTAGPADSPGHPATGEDSTRESEDQAKSTGEPEDQAKSIRQSEKPAGDISQSGKPTAGSDESEEPAADPFEAPAR